MLPARFHALSSLAFSVGVVATVAGCTEPSAPVDVPIDVTVTATEGMDGDGGQDEGLDETGSGPTEAQECLFQEDPRYFGYKYRCVGSFALKIEVNDEDPQFLSVDFGSSTSTDSYEEPLVMACCPEYEGPPCAEPHEQACVIDMVEQGCKSLVTRLEELAHGEEEANHPVRAEAMRKVADWIAQQSSQLACLDAFVGVTGVTTTVPSCDADNNSVFVYDEAVDGAVWSFNPDNTPVISDVRLTIEDPEVVAWTAPGEPPQPDECESSGDNDHLSFLQVDPTIGDVKVRLAAGSISLFGPKLEGEAISGNATLSSIASQCATPHCSHAAWSLGTSGSGELHSMSWYSSGPASVATSAEEMMVDSFQFHLSTSARGTVANGKLTIPAGDALFVVSGTSLGESRWLPAWNATALDIYHVGDQWAISAFTIGYQDALGDPWLLEFAHSSWQ